MAKFLKERADFGPAGIFCSVAPDDLPTRNLHPHASKILGQQPPGRWRCACANLRVILIDASAASPLPVQLGLARARTLRAALRGPALPGL